jgi:hypothetical protein
MDEQNPENEPVQRKRNQLGEFVRVPVKEFDGLHELGPYKYENAATYRGQYLNHLRHGYGRQVWQDGSCYDGQWRDGKTNGYGR